jgi:hypothetical protein
VIVVSSLTGDSGRRSDRYPALTCRAMECRSREFGIEFERYSSEDDFGNEGRGMKDDESITLYRPVGPKELELVRTSGYRALPPRLPEQPIFYPVLNRGIRDANCARLEYEVVRPRMCAAVPGTAGISRQI